MFTPLQFIPTFPQLVDTLWLFFLAWIGKYWWAVMIVGVFYYTRWYRIVFRARGTREGSHIAALQVTTSRLADLATESLLRTAAVVVFVVGVFTWLLQSVGTLWYGVLVLDPISVANVVAILASAAAALGVEWITFRIVIGLFLAAAGAALFIRYASAFSDEVD